MLPRLDGYPPIRRGKANSYQQHRDGVEDLGHSSHRRDRPRRTEREAQEVSVRQRHRRRDQQRSPPARSERVRPTRVGGHRQSEDDQGTVQVFYQRAAMPAFLNLAVPSMAHQLQLRSWAQRFVELALNAGRRVTFFPNHKAAATLARAGNHRGYYDRRTGFPVAIRVCQHGGAFEQILRRPTADEERLLEIYFGADVWHAYASSALSTNGAGRCLGQRRRLHVQRDKLTSLALGCSNESIAI